jgi:signal transduction histidine kinase
MTGSAQLEIPTILVIDDAADGAHILCRGLERRGYRCILSASGEQGLAQLATEAIDLAIVDIGLPGMDGIEVVRRIKEQQGEEAYLPVMLISGTAVPADRAFASGADDFVGKPIDLAELELRVKTLLLRRRQHRALAEANQKLRELQRKKQELAALVVHDLRNPLSALRGNLELLNEYVGGKSDTVDACLGDCIDLARRALSLAAGLLDVEELEEGLLAAEVRPTRLHDFVHQISTYHRTTMEMRKLSLSFDVAPSLEASFDQELVARIIENLLDNAVRYAPRGGRVAISAHLDEGALVLRVGNSGPPVPEGETQRIFERYYRIEARRAGARANRGLGLYFCKLAAEAHGGSISVEALPDLPATFVLRLPQ